MPASAFIDALLASPLPLIMEVKRRDGHDVDLMGSRTTAEVVSAYVQAGAPCISVVTGRWFGGDDELLREVAALTDLPLLKKDFITRERQIAAAKEMGAAALLLTARILPKSSFQKLIDAILAHGLTPFVEVADSEELASVIHPERCIVAINNKDIRNQERDGGELDVSRALLAATIATGTPCPVSASAISDPRVAAELVHDGFKGLLIGTGLLQADSVAGWVKQFGERRDALDAALAEPPAGADRRECEERSSVR
jgi:indole-3-glycerol phosphate synthase